MTTLFSAGVTGPRTPEWPQGRPPSMCCQNAMRSLPGPFAKILATLQRRAASAAPYRIHRELLFDRLLDEVRPVDRA